MLHPYSILTSSPIEIGAIIIVSGMPVGLMLMLYAQIKYNKGLF